MGHRTLRASLLTAACLSFFSQGANAAGFYLQEQGASGMGTAYAGAVADTPDASTVFYNPAGMTELPRMEALFGATLLDPHADFQNRGSTVAGNATRGTSSENPFNPAVVPHAYLSVPVLPDQLWFGIAVTAPFGLSNEYDHDFVGRYNSTQNDLSVIDVAPSLAWKVNPWLSIGGGLDIQRADAKLENAIPNPTPGAATPATDGLTDLSGNDISTGVNFGVQVKPIEGTKVGFTYRQGVSHTLEGRVITTLPTALPGGLAGLSGVTTRSSNSNAELDLPDIASLGFSQKVDDKLTLLGSVNWYKWSNFDDIPILAGPSALAGQSFRRQVQDYQNTWGFAIGGRYKLYDNLTLKAGFQYDQTPTVDKYRTTRIPDGDRTWYTAGATYDINDSIALDLSAMYVDVSKEHIDITDISTIGPSNTVVRTTGETSGSVGAISTGIRFKF